MHSPLKFYVYGIWHYLVIPIWPLATIAPLPVKQVHGFVNSLFGPGLTAEAGLFNYAFQSRSFGPGKTP
jgi:hypothetical protein